MQDLVLFTTDRLPIGVRSRLGRLDRHNTLVKAQMSLVSDRTNHAMWEATRIVASQDVLDRLIPGGAARIGALADVGIAKLACILARS
jgi:hypothetical protein